MAIGRIIGVECALGYQGLCRFMSDAFPMYLYDGDMYLQGMPTLVGIGKYGMPTEDELVVVNGKLMTNPIRSIIDLMRINPYSEYLVQALIELEEKPEVIDEIKRQAEKHGLTKELGEAFEDAVHFYDEG